MKWEYKVETIRISPAEFKKHSVIAERLGRELNASGEDGWELVAIRDVAGVLLYFYKRPKG